MTKPAIDHNERLIFCILNLRVQERGVEPLHLSVQDPKSCASANSATPAANEALEAGIAKVSRFEFQVSLTRHLKLETRNSKLLSTRRSTMARPVTLFTGQWADLSFD